MCFDVENECIWKKFQECNTKDLFLLGTQKESIFGEFFFMLIFLNTSIANYLMYFLNN